MDSKGSKAEAGRPCGRPLESSGHHGDDGGLIKVVPLEMMMVWFWLYLKAELTVVLSTRHLWIETAWM